MPCDEPWHFEHRNPNRTGSIKVLRNPAFQGWLQGVIVSLGYAIVWYSQKGLINLGSVIVVWIAAAAILVIATQLGRPAAAVSAKAKTAASSRR